MGDFINRLNRENEDDAKRPKFDPVIAKTEWLSNLKALLDNINTWLTPAVRAGTANVSSQAFSISEELLGNYEASGLALDFGKGRRVLVEPIAGICIGASGRVELHFRGCRTNGTVVLLHGGERWVIWPNQTHLRQNPSAIPTLDQGTFEALLDSLV